MGRGVPHPILAVVVYEEAQINQRLTVLLGVVMGVPCQHPRGVPALLALLVLPP